MTAQCWDASSSSDDDSFLTRDAVGSDGACMPAQCWDASSSADRGSFFTRDGVFSDDDVDSLLETRDAARGCAIVACDADCDDAYADADVDADVDADDDDDGDGDAGDDVDGVCSTRC